MPRKNKEEVKAYRREWYLKNRQKEIDRAARNTRKREKENRQWLIDYKKTLKCSRCEEDHPACIDFHHLDPNEKEVNVSAMIYSKGWTRDRMLLEIAKCEPLCSNCHRKEHFSEMYN
jgi:Fe-S-cluster-containing dehydrogenase component